MNHHRSHRKGMKDAFRAPLEMRRNRDTVTRDDFDHDERMTRTSLMSSLPPLLYIYTAARRKPERTRSR